MDIDTILTILKIISFIFTLTLVIWGTPKLTKSKVKGIFVVMLGSFFLSTVLFFPEGRINDWLKHIPFYFGQFFLYLFLANIIEAYSPISKKPQSSPQPQLALIPGGFSNWFNFLTDQGLQHLITLPFLFLIVTVIRIQYLYIESAAFKSALNLFMLAGTALVMIHMGEFVVENHGWLPFLEEAIEVIEFLWYYLGLILIGFAVSKLTKVHAT